MTKVVVFVEGGVVQNIVCDQGDLQVLIVDYDKEEEIAYGTHPTREFEPVFERPNLVKLAAIGNEAEYNDLD